MVAPSAAPAAEGPGGEGGEGKGGAARRRGKQRANSQGGAGAGETKDPVGKAIGEIKEQIRAQGGSGRVQIDGWRQRFGAALGPLREFLESRPDKFIVELTQGGKGFIVSEIAQGRKRRQRDGAGLWEEEEVQEPGVKRRRVAAGPGDSESVAGAAVAPAKNPVSSAIQEIKGQLQEQGGVGQVRIQNWQQRFAGELGSLKQFVHSRPDKFTVTPTPGVKGFTVALADGTHKGGGKGGKAAALAITNGSNNWKGAAKGKGKGEAKGKGKGKGKGWEAPAESGNYVGDAIKEIKQQLREQGGSGKVFVEDWGARYGEQLGSLKDFLESRPDKFEVHATASGRRFTVSLAGAGGGWGSGGAVSKGKGRGPAALALTIQPISGKGKGKGKGKDKARGMAVPQESADIRNAASVAIREIKSSLHDQGGSGKVWVEDWSGRFGHTLGSLRQFVEARPHKFEVISFKPLVAAVAGGGNAGGRQIPAAGKAAGKGRVRQRLTRSSLWSGAVASRKAAKAGAGGPKPKPAGGASSVDGPKTRRRLRRRSKAPKGESPSL